MSNHEQIIERMLHEGTITTQQSELVRDLLTQSPHLDIVEAIEQIQSLSPIESNHESSNDTLFFEHLEELVDDEKI